MVPEDDMKFALFAQLACHECKKSANFMSKDAILKKECKKVLINSLVMVRFS